MQPEGDGIRIFGQKFNVALAMSKMAASIKGLLHENLQDQKAADSVEYPAKVPCFEISHGEPAFLPVPHILGAQEVCDEKAKMVQRRFELKDIQKPAIFPCPMCEGPDWEPCHGSQEMAGTFLIRDTACSCEAPEENAIPMPRMSYSL
jgi:hypothetical protein